MTSPSFWVVSLYVFASKTICCGFEPVREAQYCILLQSNASSRFSFSELFRVFKFGTPILEFKFNFDFQCSKSNNVGG